MYLKRFILIITALLLYPIVSLAQEQRSSATIEFKVGSAYIDTNYKNNAANLNEIIKLVKEIKSDTSLEILSIEFRGSASPDGNTKLNKELSNKRLHALEEYIRSRVSLPDSIVTRNDAYIPWHELIAMVESSNMEMRDSVLLVLNMEPKEVTNHVGKAVDHRVLKLKEMADGRVFAELNKDFFMQMRSARVAFITKQHRDTTKVDPIFIEHELENEHPEDDSEGQTSEPEPMDPLQWTPHILLKTNAIGWAMGVTNFAVEIDLGQHWSLNIPVYYSGYNYFKSTVKFRTFAVQPGIRYWFRESEDDGVFLEGHFGMAYYNFALNNDFRIQDHEGDTPALGGGLSVGYRMPIGKKERWKMEFSAGLGAYKAHYDKYHNLDNTTEGLYYETVRKTFVGLDHAAISFSYMFNLKKRAKR